MRSLLLLNILIIYIIGLGYSGTISKIGLLVVLLLNLFTIIRLFCQRKTKSFNVEAVLLFALISLFFILLLNGNQLYYFISYFTRSVYYLTLFYLFYLFALNKKEMDTDRIIFFLGKFTFLVGIFSLFLYLVINHPVYINTDEGYYGILTNENFFGRNIISGPFISVNEFADLQVFLLIFSIYGLVKGNKSATFGILLSIILLFMAISRTAIFISFLVIISYALIYRKLTIKNIVFLGLSIIFIVPFVYNYDIFYFLNKFEQKELFSGREILWNAALYVIKDHLFLGTPIQQIRDLYDYYLDESLQGLGAHNTYLHLLTIVGISGFVVFVNFILTLLKIIRKDYLSKEDTFILLCLFYVVIIRGFFESGVLFLFIVRLIFVWTLFALIVGRNSRFKTGGK